MNNHRFEFLENKLKSLRQTDSLRSLHTYAHQGMTLVDVDKRRLINFGSNDYLGLASTNVGPGWGDGDANFRNARPLTLAHSPEYRGEGTLEPVHVDPDLLSGAGASALVSGFTTLHQRLCQSLAALEETEAAVLFPSGYAACSGTVATLAEAGDMLLSDELNHASLIDGCRLSRATRFIYPHQDVDTVRELLVANRHKFTRAWIITDGVFGMDGDVAPLEPLCDLAEQFDSHILVDEAHATGVLGNDGSGACGELGVKSRVAIRIGTLSKAIGSHGGFVVGPQVVIDYLVNRCRSLIFSTAGSPLTIAAAIHGVAAIQTEPQRRERVRTLSQRFRQQIKIAPVSRLSNSTVADVPIVPVVLGSNLRALRLAEQLREAGFFVPAIRPPTVPPGTARLRISLSASHQEADIDRLAERIAAYWSTL